VTRIFAQFAAITGLTLFLIPSSGFAQETPKKAAIVNGEAITEDQVQTLAGPDLQRLEAARAQFELSQERDRQTALQNALDRLIDQRVLDVEAKKRDITVDALVKAEVDDKTPEVSDAAVDKFYQDNKARINGSLVQLQTQIRSYLHDQEKSKVFANFLGRLKKDYKVVSYLEPARTEVATKGHPVRGPENAPVTIVEFSDFQCPYCGGLFPTLKEVEKNYKDKVRIVYRQFPLTSIHPNAEKAAEASLCANEQDKFWLMHDAMFGDQAGLDVDGLKQKATKLSLDMTAFNTCLDGSKYAPYIQTEIAEGTRVGVNGTPSLFVNGRFLNGNQPYEAIQQLIDDELQRIAAKQ
jgi:protein-disulfide isomerase